MATPKSSTKDPDWASEEDKEAPAPASADPSPEWSKDEEEKKDQATSTKEDEEDLAFNDKAKMTSVEHPPEFDKNPCKFPDFFVGVAWVLCLCAMIGLACDYGVDDAGNSLNKEEKKDVRRMIQIIITSFVVSLAASLVVLHIMMRFGGAMIHVALIMVELLLVGCAVGAIDLSYWLLMTICFVACLGVLLFHYFHLNTIKFSATTLQVGCEVVLGYTMLQLLSLLSVIAVVLVFFAFSMTIYGFVLDQQDKDARDGQYVLPILIFILIFLWTQQVFRYITIATVAGSSQAWWYGKEGGIRERPAVQSLFRNITYNLGSICFGALLVALIENTVLFVSWLRKKASGRSENCCVNCCLSACTACLSCCTSVLDYFNSYAFVYVGIHGYSYLYAGKKVVDLFNKQGVTVVSTDYFLANLFFVISIALGVISALFADYLVTSTNHTWEHGRSDAKWIAGFVCGIGGYCISSVTFSLVNGAHKAVVVLFAENPHILEINHNVEYQRLSKVWSLLSPDEEAPPA